MKLLTITIPCYNSAEYMDRAVESALKGGDEVEIIIVNDGSMDDTGEVAETYARKYPERVQVIHQENGGHGSAVNTGLANATGVYFKVLDSDDWLSEKALRKMLQLMKDLLADGNVIDLLLANYVYEKPSEEKRKVMRYRTALPKDEVFGWEDVKFFRQSQYILMHSAIYRTKLLKDCGLELPKHTFYVDNIFVYQPLPFVKTMYYLDVNLYRYYIGREDQSVSEKNMIARIDQQLLVTRYMLKCHDILQIKNKKLKNYMVKYLTMMMTVSSVYLIKAETDEALVKKDELWKDLEQHNKTLYRKIRSNILGRSMNLPGSFGRKIVEVGYNISKKIYGFS